MTAASATLQDSLSRAAAAFQRGAWAESERWCRAALALRADAFDALHILGLVAARTGRMAEAHDGLVRAVKVFPGSADCWNNLGLVQRELGRRLDALASFDRALAIAPNHVMALNGRGVVLRDVQRVVEALESFDRALAADASSAETHANRGNALVELRRHDEAAAAYARALALAPGTPWLPGALVYARMNACDWEGIEPAWEAIRVGLARGERVSIPFPVLSLPLDALSQRAAARITVADRHGRDDSLGVIAPRPRGERLRIGYFSANFHEHPVGCLLAGALERHDRAAFHVAAFSWGPDTGDAMRRRLVAAFDEFIDVRSRTDREVAALARERGIDIAIDLMGFTTDARPGIFALRAAPVQAGFLGYAGTMGAPYMDYFIGDAETLAPAALRDSFDERLVFLPGCYHPQDPRREWSGPAPSRESQGLPPAGFVFCCFNAPYKILPATFDRWMRILARVEGSVLWLRAPGEVVVANLRREASRRGIDPRRLVFAPRVPREEHLARHACAGLFLDTLPFNAHSTACDALWAGLPVLTCAGNTFAGRVAASLLRAAGLPELVTASTEAYEEEAVRLATQDGVLPALAERLRRGTPLHDTDTWVRHFETALARMAARWHAGLPPETFEVKP